MLSRLCFFFLKAKKFRGCARSIKANRINKPAPATQASSTASPVNLTALYKSKLNKILKLQLQIELCLPNR